MKDYKSLITETGMKTDFEKSFMSRLCTSAGKWGNFGLENKAEWHSILLQALKVFHYETSENNKKIWTFAHDKII
jgi:hypothetical protein